MRQISLFAIAAPLILAGVGGWAASTMLEASALAPHH
jgi:hypothetical protein